MGEPMLNYDNVANAVKILTEGLKYGKNVLQSQLQVLYHKLKDVRENLG